ncbi:MAG: hypothetical protein K6U02_10280 [Firmicutes bacterium]|nr:hypothetical protein [Bacillota bacterium]
MRTRYALAGLAVLAAAATVAAQPPRTPNTADLYCSGWFTNEPVPRDTYLISGEESEVKTVFAEGDYVYLNKGAQQGARVGDEFLIVRPSKDESRPRWFYAQDVLERAMGRLYADKGRVRIVVVLPEVSIARVIYSCDSMWRGDLALPYTERPAPTLRSQVFDRFAPPSGKPVAMLVQSKDFRQLVGQNDIVYVNLGSEQGVQVGDYVRIFRYPGSRHESAYVERGRHYRLYGFGSTPTRYRWDDLPREVLGEGIVLRTGPNAATVLITYSLRGIYLGDYIEIQ